MHPAIESNLVMTLPLYCLDAGLGITVDGSDSEVLYEVAAEYCRHRQVFNGEDELRAIRTGKEIQLT